MRPYVTRKLTDQPDVLDITREGRKSSIGRLHRGETMEVFPHGIVSDKNGVYKGITRTIHHDRGYCKSKHKRSIRRYLKRADKAKIMRIDVNGGYDDHYS